MSKKVPGKFTAADCEKIVAKVVNDHLGSEKPQLLIRDTPLESLRGHVHKIGDVLMVRWSKKSPFKYERLVIHASVVLDFTHFKTTPTDDDVRRQINETRANYLSQGWRFTEEEAYADLLRELEYDAQHFNVDLLYGKTCRGKTLDCVGNLVAMMTESRIHMEYVRDTREEYPEHNFRVIPNDLAKIVTRKKKEPK